MEKNSCIKELNQILNLAKKVDYLWEGEPKREIGFYFSMPEPDESARIFLVKNNGEFGFNASGSYFTSFLGKRRDLNPEELVKLASNLLENKALTEGHLLSTFRRALRLPLGYYLADRELKRLE